MCKRKKQHRCVTKAKPIILISAVLLLLFGIQKKAWALEVKILGPQGDTLAPDTEYGFGVWIRNPDALWDDANPHLELSVTGGTATGRWAGTFEQVGGMELTWDSNVLPQQKGLIGYLEIRTDATGQLILSLTGTISGASGSDDKNYTIATLSGECWPALRDLADSRASTNADFASLYTSLCNNTTPLVSGYELFSHVPQSQKNGIHTVQLLTMLLGGVFDTITGLGDIFLDIEQNWSGLPDFLGAFYLWDRFTGAVDRYTWYYLWVINVADPPLPLGPIPGYFDNGYLNLIHDEQFNEASAWDANNVLAALSRLETEEGYINNALLITNQCIINATDNNDIQGYDFFSGLKKHLEGELEVIDKLKWVAGTLDPPEVLDDASTYIEPDVVVPGDTFSMHYHVKSWFPNDVNAWLGATIRKHDHSFWHSDGPHDAVITLLPGTNSYSRGFTVRPCAPPGSYDVFWAIHSGNVVGEGTTWDQLIRDGVLTVLPDRDLNGDGNVDFLDFTELAKCWLESCPAPDWCGGANLDLSGEVALPDLKEFAKVWLARRGIQICQVRGPLSLDTVWPPQAERGPSWSPDGAKIAYAWGDGYTASDPCLEGKPNPDGSCIVTMTVDGNEIRGSNNPLVNDVGWDNGHPDWSPDGDWIVYKKSQVGPAQILKVLVADSNMVVPITEINGDWHPRFPKWSPDGNSIAYSGGYWHSDYHIWLTDPNGNSHEDLTPSITGSVTGLSWSPDGTEIAFVQGDPNVFVLDVQTKEIRGLPAFPNNLTPGGLVWCSERDSLLFDAGGNIYCYRIDTRETTQLTNEPDSDWLGDWHPAWGIVFSSDKGCTVRWDSDIYVAETVK